MNLFYLGDDREWRQNEWQRRVSDAYSFFYMVFHERREVNQVNCGINRMVLQTFSELSQFDHWW